MNRAKFLFGVLFFGTSLALVSVVDRIDAFSSGLLGYSGNPATNGGSYCNHCHNTGIVPIVSLTGPAVVTPGSTNVYTLTISGGQQAAGGLDVSSADEVESWSSLEGAGGCAPHLRLPDGAVPER